MCLANPIMAHCFTLDSYSPITRGFANGDYPPLERASGLKRRSRFWQWTRCWIHAKKACLCRDLAMGNEELMVSSGGVICRQLFWKLKARLRKSMKSRPSQRFTYDASSYAQNFDDGCWQDSHPDPHFGCRFGAKPDPLGICKPCS